MAAAAGAAYNAMSPTTAQGTGLSSVVKINGLVRMAAFNSTVNLVLTGEVGYTINNGIVQDTVYGYQWALPAIVTFPGGGTITVTATCTTAGPVVVGIGTVIDIVNPTAEWFSATNPAVSAAGQLAEQDGALRSRQTNSTALPSQTLQSGLQGALLSLTGVTRAVVYVNNTNTTDGNGTPAYTTWCVVEGGTVSSIGNTIALEKNPGPPLRGTVSYSYDPPGAPAATTILWDVPVQNRIVMTVNITPLANFNSATEAEIQQQLANYVNSLPIGGVLAIGYAIGTAQLFPLMAQGNMDGATFRVESLTMGIYGGSQAQADITIPAGQTANLLNLTDIVVNT
jgi:uncharacterized phage protein gp47/JayE